MGTTKLKTSFKQLQGCTITEYIQQRRMSQAEHLLIDTDFTIGQIAEMIGYSTSSRFAELFRKSTGLLPIEYRKCLIDNSTDIISFPSHNHCIISVVMHHNNEVPSNPFNTFEGTS